MNFEQARAVAERQIRDGEDPSFPLVLLDQTLERSWCWVFFYQSKAFLETGDFEHCLLGNRPIVVNKADGELWRMGTAKRPEFYLAEYAKEHGLPVE